MKEALKILEQSRDNSQHSIKRIDKWIAKEQERISKWEKEKKKEEESLAQIENAIQLLQSNSPQ